MIGKNVRIVYFKLEIELYNSNCFKLRVTSFRKFLFTSTEELRMKYSVY